MKKKLFQIGIIILLSIFVSSIASAVDQQEILKRLDYLQKKLNQQQQIIEDLKNQKNADKNIESPVKEEEKNNFQISRHIDSLKLKGDLRLRYEYRKRDESKNRNRMRTRFRLGGTWVNSNENWEVAAGLATGDESATSTNDTWSDDSFFETGDIRLDYAYAKHTMNEFTFTAGQQKNPFETSWLLWDSDVRPAGFTANYNRKSFFITAGGYDVIQYGHNFGSLYAGQIGSNLNPGDLKIILALAYYSYEDGIFGEDEVDRPNPDYEFKIADLYVSVELPVDKIKFNVYGQFFNNFGADGDKGEGVLGSDLDPSDESTGWVIGLDSKIGKLKCGYSYAEVGADSCIGDLKDADFGSGVNNTDIKGHKIKIGYKITDHFTVGATALFYKALELSDQDEADLYQIDMSYKF